MADSGKNYKTVAALRNVMAMVSLVQRVKDRAPTLPGMAVFYGHSGYGKTTAATYAANVFNAYHVQAQSTWTKKSLCEALLTELGLEIRGRVDQMVRDISREVAATGRPLLIDEADHLVARNLVELVRDIYEGSEASIILIGEEELPRKLMRWERIHGRMLGWVRAEEGVMSDVTQLMKIYCPDLEIEPALLERILTDSRASIRRICVNLDAVRLHAVGLGITRVTEDDWGDRTFFTGQAPNPRAFK